MENFAIIDTETNWKDEVMSIGVVAADAQTFDIVNSKYYIITPEYLFGGMFSYALREIKPELTVECSRGQAVKDIIQFLNYYNINSVFAYNAAFDYRHLPELRQFCWYDIMRVAAYRQFNPKIKQSDCYSTGRLMRNYGVESMINLLTGGSAYCESHNALNDATDELTLMKLLKRNPENYIKYEPPQKPLRRTVKSYANAENEILPADTPQLIGKCRQILNLCPENIKAVALHGGIKGFVTFKCLQCKFEWSENADMFLDKGGTKCPKCIR